MELKIVEPDVHLESFESNKIPVLDKGYVRLVDHLGSDLSVVRSARASYEKEVGDELTDQDARLIYFLMREKHYSVLRHCHVTLEMRTPLMVARQLWKHIVGSEHTETQVGWNEASRRYITSDEEFYLPKGNQWRGKPENSKQGSKGYVDELVGSFYTDALERYQKEGEDLYHKAIEAGIAPEQARLFLPAYGLYVNYYWTGSLQAIMNFLSLRMAHDSQWEIQQYAKAIYRLTQPLYPVTFSAAGLS